jgi:hypothetical protein
MILKLYGWLLYLARCPCGKTEETMYSLRNKFLSKNFLGHLGHQTWCVHEQTWCAHCRKLSRASPRVVLAHLHRNVAPRWALVPASVGQEDRDGSNQQQVHFLLVFLANSTWQENLRSIFSDLICRTDLIQAGAWTAVIKQIKQSRLAAACFWGLHRPGNLRLLGAATKK